MFSDEMPARELVNTFQTASFPGIVFIENGEIVRIMNYSEICTWLSDYENVSITY